MSLDYESLSDKFNKIMCDPEQVKRAKAYFKKIEDADAMRESQVERFHHKHKDDFNVIVEKIITKYDSKAYKDRWYNRGIAPPETLKYLLFDIAVKYGKEFTQEECIEYNKYNDMFFTDSIYTLNGWSFEHISGQGTAIMINKS